VLVTFKTSAYSDITLFGGAAVSLLKLMGQSGNVPGAILAADIPEALETLHQGLEKLSQSEDPGETNARGSSADDGWGDSDDAPPVALQTRAGPLISLLEAAQAATENVQWDS